MSIFHISSAAQRVQPMAHAVFLMPIATHGLVVVSKDLLGGWLEGIKPKGVTKRSVVFLQTTSPPTPRKQTETKVGMQSIHQGGLLGPVPLERREGSSLSRERNGLLCRQSLSRSRGVPELGLPFGARGHQAFTPYIHLSLDAGPLGNGGCRQGHGHRADAESLPSSWGNFLHCW